MEQTNETVAMNDVQENGNDLGTARKHFSKLGLMFFLGTLIITGVQYGVAYLVSYFKPEWLESPNMVLTLSMIPLYVIGMPILIALVKRVPAVTIEKRSMKVWQYLLAIVICFFLMYGSNIIGAIITQIIGILKGSPVSNVLADITNGTSLLLTFAYTVVCAPVMEEYIFRKLIVDRTVRYGQGVAVLLSGLMFGLFHGNLNQFAYAFTLGLFLAFLYVKTGQLKYTIGLHMIINFFGGVFVMGLMEMMNYDALMEVINSGAGEKEILSMVMQALPAWIIYLVYIMLVMAMMVAGLVLLIVFRKRFTLEKTALSIPKGKRFTTVLLNLGMVLFILYWIVEIIKQLIA